MVPPGLNAGAQLTGFPFTDSIAHQQTASNCPLRMVFLPTSRPLCETLLPPLQCHIPPKNKPLLAEFLRRTGRAAIANPIWSLQGFHRNPQAPPRSFEHHNIHVLQRFSQTHPLASVNSPQFPLVTSSNHMAFNTSQPTTLLLTQQNIRRYQPYT